MGKRQNDFRELIDDYEESHWEGWSHRRLNYHITQHNVGKYVDFVLDTWGVAMPEKLPEFVHERCLFKVLDPWESNALATPVYPGTEYLIIIWGRVDKEVFRSPNIAGLIAHEIAHAWLGHRRGDKKSHRQHEREANKEVRKWGVPLW